MYLNYNDDILFAFDKNLFDNHLATINNIYPCLAFTFESENEGILPFLDMEIIFDGILSSKWYRKPTDSDWH